MQTLAYYPMHQTSADLFQLAGQHYLGYADWFSGMLWYDCFMCLATDRITGLLTRWFEEYGYHAYIWTDGGPFRGPFKEWCTTKGIIHELSRAYHTKSNGHAEQAVKKAKYLLNKVHSNMPHFLKHLLAWCNTQSQNGASPCELLFGRWQRTGLPSLAIELPHPLNDVDSSESKRHATY